jgi:hypothetical protein
MPTRVNPPPVEVFIRDLLIHSAPAAAPKTVPCDRCVRGTVEGTNGTFWRCSFCGGVGRVRSER